MGGLRTSTKSPKTQEVRIATTMTGGVSLAVWMAGVARELDLLRQASARREIGYGVEARSGEPTDSAFRQRQRYQRLLEVLDVVVDPDIYSGTSAGGINAVMLAYARATGGDLGGVREMWLELGDMSQLLREPSEKDVPSLMYGDRHLYAKLRERLRDITRSRDAEAAAVPSRTTLYVTTTMLTGESSRFSDSLGTQVQDTEHRAVFTFEQPDLQGDQDAIIGPLALAGRSTASFPGAFEPAFVPYDTPVPGTKHVPPLPAMKEYVNITRDHWVADGGLLDNQPIDVLLRRVFDSTAERRVRRVLLYVVPSTGPAVDVVSSVPGDERTEPYGMLDGLLQDLNATVNQSIGSDLRSIMTHNQRITARGRLRLHLAELGSARGRLLGESLHEDYLRSVSDAQASALVTALLERLSTIPSAELPESWRPLLSIGGTAELQVRRGVADAIRSAWLPAGGALPSTAPVPAEPAAFARYGQAAYDGAKSVVLALLRLAYDATDSAARLTALTAGASAAERAEVFGSTSTMLEKLTCLGKRLHANQRIPAGGSLDELCDEPDDVRPQDVRVPAPDDVVHEVLGAVTRDERRSLDEVAAAIGERWTAETVGAPSGSGPQVSEAAWTGLGTILRAVVKALPDDVRTDDALVPYLTYGGLGPGADPESVSSDDVATRLFDLVVAERAMLPEGAGPYQAVELVQVSADTRSRLANRDQWRASGKLTGMQFHHFGAFYKRTWRANDWMWGRLDGAGWLVYTLLDPRRLRSRVARKRVEDDASGTAASWVAEQLGAEFGLEPAPDAVAAELEYLDHPDREAPRGLPETALWLAQAWQRPVADDELRNLADLVVGTPDAGKPDVSPADTRAWARKVKTVAEASPELVHRELRTCPVSRETFMTDRGTPLMIQTLTKAAATGTGAVRSISQLPGPAVPAVTTARSVALAGYRIAGGVRGSHAWLIVAGLAMLLLGIALAITTADLFGLGGVLTATVGGYLVVFGAWQGAGWKMVSGSLLSVTAVAALAFLVTPTGRSYLFDVDNEQGVARGALDWLAAQPWRPLVVVGALVVAFLVGVASATPRRVRGSVRRRAGRQRAAARPSASGQRPAPGPAPARQAVRRPVVSSSPAAPLHGPAGR